MPVSRRVSSVPGFEPDDVRVIVQAFNRACLAMNASEDQPSFRELIACKIITNAQTGERDPDRLCAWVVGELRTGLVA